MGPAFLRWYDPVQVRRVFLSPEGHPQPKTISFYNPTGNWAEAVQLVPCVNGNLGTFIKCNVAIQHDLVLAAAAFRGADLH